MDVELAPVTAWRARIEQERLVAHFATAEDLAGKVIAALVEALPTASSREASRPPAPPVRIPRLLPYLSDRGPQEAAIAKALAARAPYPVVWIVHGDEQQSHGELRLRLQEDTLPRLLELGVAVTELEMPWPPDFATADELQELLLLGLAIELSLAQAAVGRIDAALEALPGRRWCTARC